MAPSAPFHRWLRGLRILSADALRTLRWNDEAGGFRLIGAAWRAGVLGRFGLGAVVVGTVVTALMLASGPASATMSVELVALVLGLLTLGLGLGLSAARAMPLPVYVITALAIAWYALLPAGGVAGTALFALPPLWLLFVGARLAADQVRPWPARIGLGVLALGVGGLTRGAFGLASSDPTLDVVAGVGLGIALGLIAIVSLDRVRRTALSPSALAIGTVAAFALPWGVSLAVDPSGTGERVALLARGLLLPLDLFWLWLGATTFQGAIEVGAWTTRTASRLVGPRALAITLPIVWVAVGLFAWLATCSVGDGPARWAHELGLTAWAATWDDGVWFAVRWQVWASLVVLALMVVGWLRSRDADRRAAQVNLLNGLWLAAFLGVLGLWSAAEDAIAAGDDAQPTTTWATVLLVGGIVWEVARSGGDWGRGARVMALLGGLVAILGVIAATLGAGTPQLFVEYGYYAFIGVVVLGLPMAIADVLGGDEDEAAPSGAAMVGWALVGAASASVVMGIDPWAGPALSIAPIAWAAALLCARSGLPSLRAWATAGAALGVGFGVFWLSPEALPLPLFDAWQARYLSVPLARPVFALGAFAMPLVTMGLGVALGLALGGLRGVRRWAVIPLGCAAIAVGVPWLPDVPTGPPSPSLSPIQGSTVAGWLPVELAGTGLAIDTPPGWRDAPRAGLLANRIEPRGRALLSAALLPGDDLAEVAGRDRETWLAIAPERREGAGFVYAVGGRPALRTTWTSLRSTGAEVFIAVGDEGVLRVALLAEPDAFAELEPVLVRGAASVRQRARGATDNVQGPGSGTP